MGSLMGIPTSENTVIKLLDFSFSPPYQPAMMSQNQPDREEVRSPGMNEDSMQECIVNDLISRKLLSCLPITQLPTVYKAVVCYSGRNIPSCLKL